MKKTSILIYTVIFLLKIVTSQEEDEKNENSSLLFGFTKTAITSASQISNFIVHNDRTRGKYNGVIDWVMILDGFNIIKRINSAHFQITNLFSNCFGCCGKEKKNNTPSPLPTSLNSPSTQTTNTASKVEEYKSLVEFQTEQPKPSKRVTKNENDLKEWNDENVLQTLCEMAANSLCTRTTIKSDNFDVISSMCLQMNRFKYGTIEFILQVLQNMKNLKKLEWFNYCDKKDSNRYFREKSEIIFEPFPNNRINELDQLIEKLTQRKQIMMAAFEEKIQNEKKKSRSG